MAELVKVALDAMGGDHAPSCNVKGALAAVKEYDVEVVLVGRGEEILACLKEEGVEELPAGLEIVHADQVVEMEDNPATAFKEKKNSSEYIMKKYIIEMMTMLWQQQNGCWKM